MKTRTGIIILAVVLVLFVAIVAVASIQNSTSKTTTSKIKSSKITTTVSTKTSSTTKVTVSMSTREDLAEDAVLKAFIKEMKYGYSKDLFRYYNVDATKYKIGNIERKGDKFTFYITFYFYDDYGNYEAKTQKEASVEVDEYGKVGSVSYIYFSKSDFK